MAEHAHAPARAGFTAVELLIVLAIIALLAALGVVAMRWLLFRAKALDTANRMQAVLQGLGATADHGDGNAAYRLQRDGLGEDFAWATLREVLLRHDLTATPTLVPPNLKLRAESPGDADDGGKDKGLDAQVCWLLRSRTWSAGGWHVGDRDWYLDGNRRAFPSPLGESLDGTMEVMPLDAAKPTAWYTDRWPTLTERTEARGAGTACLQSAWPASDWDADPPGTAAPRWCSPWGKRVISRASGTLVDWMEERTLADLSPLATIALLQAAGVLPAGDEGADAYRNDRGTGRAWNDRWGNPLVVVHAVFLPARYDFVGDEDSKDLKGGRDFLIRRARESYGFTRAVYLAVGAVGPKLRDPLPSPWTAADDAVALRRLWLQIRDTTDAASWTEKSFADRGAPWSGTRRADAHGERCFVTAPAEVR